MKFSIIIPLYNKAPYIRKALGSVFAQTYTDFELIIVDDGSTDDSAIIVKQFIDERLKVKGDENEVKGYRLEVKGDESSGAETNAYKLSPINYKLIRQANAGVSAARNNGVAQAQGEYIAFLDADDWWEPTYLEQMAKLIDDYPDAGLYGLNYIYYKPGKTRVALKSQTGYINYPKEYLQNKAMMIFTSSSSMPKRVFEEMGGFPLGIRLGEDFLLWAKTALHHKVAFCDQPLAYYNNDVPATLRATRNLHAPEHHMLFRMEEIIGESLKIKGEEISRADTNANNLSSITYNPTYDDWRRLIDKLRVNGLLEYWLSSEYHNLAAEELKKVDWSKQPASVIKMYKTPIWILKLKRLIMCWGSYVKQLVIEAIGDRL